MGSCGPHHNPENTITEPTASCTKCGIEKPRDQFPPNKKARSGYGSWCRSCAGVSSKSWHNKKRETCPAYREKQAVKSRTTHRRMKYGLTNEQVAAMAEAQSHRCGSCGDPLGQDRAPHIDHCHSTMKVRGLLCLSCNVALGHLRDDPARIGGLLAYLERSTAVVDGVTSTISLASPR